MVAIRLMTQNDIEFVVAQTEREGWASAAHMFSIYLAYEPGGCFVAEDAGRCVGMVTTTRYTGSAWIGNLIVIPEARSRGIGRLLMDCGLAYLDKTEASTVRLDGDPPGIPLYRSLGFVDEWESLRFTGCAARTEVPENVQLANLEDLDAITELDRACFGDDRTRLLRLLHNHAEHVIVVKKHGDVAGFLFVERTNLGLRIGPWVAVDSGTAEELLRGALSSAREQNFTVGVPIANQKSCRLLLEAGFRPTPSSWRMIRGPRVAEGRLDRVFGIAGGAVG
jgi:predicted N-acetyltransferase YhbS